MCLHIFDTDFFPVDFQLFGDQHGRRGAAALAHFGARIANDDGLIAVYINPRIHFLGLLGLRVSGQAKAQA